MGRSVAIVIAGMSVAAAIMVSNHWQITLHGQQSLVAARLDRWTGKVELCAVDIKNPLAATARVQLICEPQ
jgi:hypothetical protein